MQRLKDKVAVITGAAGDIGAATARRLVAEGARVVIVDINKEGAKRVASELESNGHSAISVTVDLEHEDQIVSMIETAVKKFGGIDILHNNAALQIPEVMSRDAAITDIDADLWERVMRVNLRSYALCAKHAIPHMLKRGEGVIINTASGTGLQSEFTRPAYGTSKAAIIGFTRNVATQYGKQGIRCIAIALGLVATSSLKANMPPHILDLFKRHFLTPYIAEPEDIAGVVAFLASSDARFITGVTITVDGGFSVHTPSYADEMLLMQSTGGGI